MKSKLPFILMLVFVALFQTVNAQKTSKKPEVDMVKLMQHRNQVLQKAAAQQRQQAAEQGAPAQGSRPTGAPQASNSTIPDNYKKRLTGTKRDNQ